MFIIALGEIVVVVVLRPLRFILGGQRTAPGRIVLRFEQWLLRHLHVMGAESRMRYELEMHGQATGFLAESLTDQSVGMASTSETITRVRDQTGANLEASQRSAQLQEGAELRRGQRRVESTGNGRSDDIHAAMLQAQRERNRQAERRRRQSRRS